MTKAKDKNLQNTTQKTKDSATRSHLNRGELMFSGRVSTSCSTNGKWYLVLKNVYLEEFVL